MEEVDKGRYFCWWLVQHIHDGDWDMSRFNIVFADHYWTLMEGMNKHNPSNCVLYL